MPNVEQANQRRFKSGSNPTIREKEIRSETLVLAHLCGDDSVCCRTLYLGSGLGNHLQTCSESTVRRVPWVLFGRKTDSYRNGSEGKPQRRADPARSPFDLFTTQNSNLLSNGQPNPNFKNFGLAWYQSDVQADSNGNADVTIKTILLDQIFGFDPAVGLPPTNTFHVGFWFNNPQDAASCGFDPTKPTPFNGEHTAGPNAMMSVPNSQTNLGPLCTNPTDTSAGFVCNP